MQMEMTTMTMGLSRNRSEWLRFRYEFSFRKLMLLLKDGFNPEQPRDEEGRWSDGSVEQSFDVAGRGREVECEAQYARDTFICNALRLRSCWERAAERYYACLRGRAIPTLRF